MSRKTEKNPMMITDERWYGRRILENHDNSLL
jgi:hypothetical protein